MHSSLEASPYRRIELPGNVCRAQDEHAFGVATYTVHLYEELGLDTSGGFGLAFAAGAAEGVDLVDEDDAGFVFAGEVEELLY